MKPATTKPDLSPEASFAELTWEPAAQRSSEILHDFEQQYQDSYGTTKAHAVVDVGFVASDLRGLANGVNSTLSAVTAQV
ncbi:hypothetical protein PI124_g19702 [Phytophthora idaei]|nr:hypothetical protein PI126_g19684 [Phytophthora idaei]KAG3235261.1 hypothetical protein PI124_g19702 [Phytophthora idaei]